MAADDVVSSMLVEAGRLIEPFIGTALGLVEAFREPLVPILMAPWLGTPVWAWLSFSAITAVLLAFDLGVMNRRKRDLRAAESTLLSAFYVLVAVAFGGWLWWTMGREPAIAFFTGFLVEKSLAVDNVFVMFAIFSTLSVPRELQQVVLFWGILGVIVLRITLIGLGAALVVNYAWILDVFALCLVATGLAMLVLNTRHRAQGRRRLLEWLRRRLRVTDHCVGERFLVDAPDAASGRIVRWSTPLLLALVLILATDLVFAVDAVPAIFAITQDPFIVFTSNLLAIVGLRALYFKLATLMSRFRHMIYSLAAILMLIGAEVLLANLVGKVPPSWSLGGTVVLLAGGVVYSLWRTRRRSRDGRVMLHRGGS